MPTATTEAATISPQRWLTGLFASVALVLALHLWITWRLDVYGIYRDPHGRHLSIARRERKTKFLLNGSYVPANFDALLLGASSSLNWQLGEMGSYHFYNESMQAADATEERLLAERAMRSGHFKLVLVGVSPFITNVHYLADGIDSVDVHEPLGSLSAMEMEFDYLLARAGIHTGAYPDGSHDMPEHVMRAHDADSFPPIPVTLDPKAINDYRTVVQELAGQGAKIVYVIYPVYGPYYEQNQAALAAYNHTMAQTLPAGPVIDLSAPQYKSFYDDPSNFIDGVHLSAKGTSILSPILIARLHQTLNEPIAQPHP